MKHTTTPRILYTKNQNKLQLSENATNVVIKHLKYHYNLCGYQQKIVIMEFDIVTIIITEG